MTTAFVRSFFVYIDFHTNSTWLGAYDKRFFGGIRVVHFFLIVFCVALSCPFTFRVPCCDVRYDFRIKNDVRFVFTSSCL
jgi:hypothetical protein